MPPRVSVVMSVYNGETYLGEAIQSILDQTFTDFEFIIIDDGSQDKSPAILRDYARRDERIRLLENPHNLGLSASLNKGIRASRGEYIARMDADDISLPSRIEEQVIFMDTNPEIGICGTWIEMFGDQHRQIEQFPLDHAQIHLRLLFGNALAHPTVMMRLAALRQFSLTYNEHIRFAQDYELWSRAIAHLRFANIGQVLLFYRIHPSTTGARFHNQQKVIHLEVYRNLLRLFGLHPTQEDLLLQERISAHQYDSNTRFLRRARKWLERIARANRECQIIPARQMDAELGFYWTAICNSSQSNLVNIVVEIAFCSLPFAGATNFHKVHHIASFIYRRITANIVSLPHSESRES